MLNAIMTIGLPAVGKTTYVSSRYAGYTIVNSDVNNDFDLAKVLTQNFGKNLIIDGCNHTALRRWAIITVLRQEGYITKGLYFDLRCDKERLRENKELRRKVIEIRKDLSPPSMSEGFSGLEYIYELPLTDKVLSEKPKRKAVFFNVDLAVTMGAEALENVLNEYHNDGFTIIAIGNQDDCSHKDYQEYLLRVIKVLRVDITDIFYCHHKGFCECRFPKTELAVNAANRYRLDLPNCIMLCVDDVDMEFGRNLKMISYKPPNASWLDRGMGEPDRQINRVSDSISNPI